MDPNQDVAKTQPEGPVDDLETVLADEIKEWHFHIYFHQTSAVESHAALQLRDAVLRLRKNGAFIAVPYFKVNMEPMGPHPVGSYEIWTPSESFASVFSYLCMNRGSLSILVHPLTRFQVIDHEVRKAWIGTPHPLGDLSMLPVRSDDVPLQYPSLGVGYSAKKGQLTLEERKRMGAQVEKLLKKEEKAARAPEDKI